MPANAAKLPAAPDRDEADALDAVLKARVEKALADTRPSLPQAQVFADLRKHHETKRA